MRGMRVGALSARQPGPGTVRHNLLQPPLPSHSLAGPPGKAEQARVQLQGHRLLPSHPR